MLKGTKLRGRTSGKCPQGNIRERVMGEKNRRQNVSDGKRILIRMNYAMRRLVALFATILFLPAWGMGQEAVNPFAGFPAGDQAAAPVPPQETPAGEVSPFGAQPSLVNPFGAPTTAMPPPAATPPAPGEISAMPAPAPVAAQPDASAPTPDIRRHIEDVKERVWAEYARGNYDKAMQEIELLEQISPNHPTAAMIRQRIRDRMMQGKPIGVPIRSEFERPVPTMVVESSEPTPVPETATTVPPSAPPVIPGSLPSDYRPKTEGINIMVVLILAASIVILVLILVLFIVIRRSRQHLHEAMSTAADSLVKQTVHPDTVKTTQVAPLAKPKPIPAKPRTAPAKPATQRPAAQRPAAAGKPASPPAPPAAPDVPPSAPEPIPVAQPPKQKEAVYDLPTTILADESEEPIWEHEKPSGSGSAPDSQRPMPPAVAAQVGNVFGGGEQSDSQTPEVQQTQGETFTPYGTTGQSVGEVISGQMKAPAGAAPPRAADAFAPKVPSPASPSPGPSAISELPPVAPLPPLSAFSGPSAAPPAPVPASVFPPMPAPSAAGFSDAQPSSGTQGLVLPDIFSTGIPSAPSGPAPVESGSISPGAPPPAPPPSFASPGGPAPLFPPVPAPVAPQPASPFPPAVPFPPMPMPPPPSAFSKDTPSGSQSGDLSLDGLLFSSGQSEAESATVSGREPVAQAGGSSLPPSAPPKGAEDMTATSFGREFDQFMFAAGGGAQDGAGDATGAAMDQTLGITTPLSSPMAEGPTSTENVLNMLVGEAKPTPAPPFTPAPNMAATQKITASSLPGAPATPFSGSDTIPLVSPALDETVKLPPTVRPLSQSAGSGDEALYQSQRQKGLAAFAAGDLKHAIHYLSVAASLRPDDQEVIQKLQEARRQRRAASGG